MHILEKNREVDTANPSSLNRSPRPRIVAYIPRRTERERESVDPIYDVKLKRVRPMQKRGFVFDVEELAAAHGGLVKKYRKV